MAIIKLRLQWAGLARVAGCEMAFRIRFRDGQYPDFELGPPGAELGRYIPEGAAWVQLHYGQAEGQVEIDGREWGFYWPEPGSLDVILHGGEMQMTQAMEFVRAVADRLAGQSHGYEVLIAGQRFAQAVKLPERQLAETSKTT